MKRKVLIVLLLVALPASSSGVFAQDVEKVPNNLVNVNFVVYQKKEAQVLTGLKRSNFAVFVDGVQKEIADFSSPDRPLTVALLVEYSGWATPLLDNGGSRLELTTYGVIEPAGRFLSQLIKLPDDKVSVIAFDMRPTPITDLTNDPKRVDQAIDLLMRNSPAFRETALFDSLKAVLIGGRIETAVLEESKTSKSDFRGLDSVQGKRKAVILIASGLDTVGKTDLKQARKIIQNAGVPIYVIGTVGLSRAKLGNRLAGEKAMLFLPGKKDLEQAESQLRTIAQETGGAYFPCITNGDVAGILHNIQAMLLGQYSLTFKPDQIRDGKDHQIEVKVDVNGDGVFEDQFVVQARTVYRAPKN